MKSKTTVRRWITDLKDMAIMPEMDVYREGMLAALRCVVYDGWPQPKAFLTFGNRAAKNKHK